MWNNFLPSSSLCSLKGADAGNGIRVFVPDVGMFIASLTIWLVCRNIVKKPDTEEVAQFNSDCENEELVSVTMCIFLLQSPRPSLWDCVESRVCMQNFVGLYAQEAQVSAVIVHNPGDAAGQTLTPTPWWCGHRWWACEYRLSRGPHSGVTDSLLVLPSPQMTIWPPCALELYQGAPPKMLPQHHNPLAPQLTTAEYSEKQYTVTLEEKWS